MRRPAEEDRASPKGELHQRLKRVLEEVGPEHYARATAREFARGGRYNPLEKRPKYARS